MQQTKKETAIVVSKIPMIFMEIVGGYKSFIGMMPWQVAILFTYPYLDYQGCGGALVSDRYVVTAAHCTYGASSSDLFVRVGDTILATEFEAMAFTYGVAEIINHEDYDDWTLQMIFPF